MRIVDVSLEIVDRARPSKAHPKVTVIEDTTAERTQPMRLPLPEGFATRWWHAGLLSQRLPLAKGAG